MAHSRSGLLQRHASVPPLPPTLVLEGADQPELLVRVASQASCARRPTAAVIVEEGYTRTVTARHAGLTGSWMPWLGSRPGEGEIVAVDDVDGDGIPRYASTSPRLGVSGDIEALAQWAGQSVGLIDEVRPAGAIVRTLAQEATAALRAGADLIRASD